MTDLRTLREEETSLQKTIILCKQIQIVTPEGTVTDLTLDATPFEDRLVEVQAEIQEAIAAKRREAAIDRDWYSNH